MDVENLTSNFILLIWIHVIYVRYMFQNAQWLYEANINPSRSPKNIMATKSTQKISSNFYPTCSQGNVSAGSIIGLGYLWYQNILKKPWHSAENGFTWSSKFTGAIKQCTPQRMACTHTHIHRSIRYEQLPFASLICSTLVPWKKHMPKKDWFLTDYTGPVRILICFFVVRRFPIRFKLVWMSRNPMRGQEFSNLGGYREMM